ncbi:hypothetical protein OSH10_13395 [Kaistia defluvii]|uniref:hypothetical protein n=1 Tax=Kaistia defluvii TaxID=410841 RepID=UPI00225BB776|nr:hypothetical protein [Kaistia defluvii]MCX5519430.1 hypothetical protein [Kaistia defluvii]
MAILDEAESRKPIRKRFTVGVNPNQKPPGAVQAAFLLESTARRSATLHLSRRER